MTYRLVADNERGAGMDVKPLHWHVYAAVLLSALIMALLFMTLDKINLKIGLQPDVQGIQRMSTPMIIWGALLRQGKMSYCWNIERFNLNVYLLVIGADFRWLLRTPASLSLLWFVNNYIKMFCCSPNVHVW